MGTFLPEYGTFLLEYGTFLLKYGYILEYGATLRIWVHSDEYGHILYGRIWVHSYQNMGTFLPNMGTFLLASSETSPLLRIWVLSY
jgi:hypothetical protein